MIKYRKCVLKCCWQCFGNAHGFLLLGYSLLATHCSWRTSACINLPFSHNTARLA